MKIYNYTFATCIYIQCISKLITKTCYLPEAETMCSQTAVSGGALVVGACYPDRVLWSECNVQRTGTRSITASKHVYSPYTRASKRCGRNSSEMLASKIYYTCSPFKLLVCTVTVDAKFKCAQAAEDKPLPWTSTGNSYFLIIRYIVHKLADRAYMKQKKINLQ